MIPNFTKLGKIPARAYRLLQRRTNRLFGRGPSNDASPATYGSLREFKEKAWQSDKAAQCYRENVEKISPGMQTELDVARHFALGRILDVATGTGRFATSLCKLGRQVIGVDISAEMLRVAAKGASNSLNCIQASAFALPFADEIFDTVMAFWLLVHFDDWSRIVAEMIRVTKPGGIVLFEAQNNENFALGRQLAPNAPFVARLQTPAGYHAFQSAVAIAQFSSRATVLWSQPYDLFNDNFVLQALLGDRYAAWFAEMQELLADESCASFWRRFESTELPNMPASLARKRLYVLRKQTVTQAESTTIGPLAYALGKQMTTPQIERSWELFRLAVDSLCPNLPDEPPCY